MSLFSKILDKLGLGKNKPTSAPSGTAVIGKTTSGAGKTGRESAGKPVGSQPASTAAPIAPNAVSETDVVKKLEQMASGSGLDWKVSIMDLLKVLGIDSSREARIELAKELGCPEDLMKDSAKMNTWLHKTVLKKIAENGGNIPKSLLD